MQEKSDIPGQKCTHVSVEGYWMAVHFFCAERKTFSQHQCNACPYSLEEYNRHRGCSNSLSRSEQRSWAAVKIALPFMLCKLGKNKCMQCAYVPPILHYWRKHSELFCRESSMSEIHMHRGLKSGRATELAGAFFPLVRHHQSTWLQVVSSCLFYGVAEALVFKLIFLLPPHNFAGLLWLQNQRKKASDSDSVNNNTLFISISLFLRGLLTLHKHK